ncbi:hypothetical protein [Pareuzebyella sediminis]|uniref:hypothetical protein n=1 Tax=Pareuzebyella sediminis TaxID=2607998 RepID=UPI0011F05CA8|nr:hypothetical protein [Pareuzebyella sediminis]
MLYIAVYNIVSSMRPLALATDGQHIVYLLLGAGLGAFVSWIVTYESERSKKRRMDTFTSIADGSVEVDIATCWKKITNPKNMAYYTIGHYGAFQDAPEDIGPGTRFERKGYQGSRQTVFISVWEPPHRFAWGNDRYDWNDYIELKKSGAATQLFLRRKYYPSTPPWHAYLFRKFFPQHGDIRNDSDLQYLTDDRLKKIINVCTAADRV